MMAMYIAYGADLPYPTLFTIDAVRNYVPWIAAAAGTLAVIVLWYMGSRFLLHACTVMGSLFVVMATFAMVSFALPMMKCGFSWPQWPSASTGPAPAAQGQASDVSTKCS
jgi:hypothetical protein